MYISFVVKVLQGGRGSRRTSPLIPEIQVGLCDVYACACVCTLEEEAWGSGSAGFFILRKVVANRPGAQFPGSATLVAFGEPGKKR